MSDAATAAQQHFAAGDIESAYRSLLDTPAFEGKSLQEVHELTELKVVGDLPSWARRNAERTVVLDSFRRPPDAPSAIHAVEADGVSSLPIAFNDGDPGAYLLPDVTVPSGMGTISTRDHQVLPVAPDWGERVPPGRTASFSYGVIATRDETDEFLTHRPPPSETIAEGLYLWAGCKHFPINLLNLVHAAVLREAVGETRLPLIAQRKGLPPRQFEMEAIRKMGFEHNELIVLEHSPTTLVKKLWVPHCPITLFPEHILSSSGAMNVFRRRVGVVERSGSGRGDRLYVTRKDAKWRFVEEEERIVGMLKASYGFRTIEFSGMDIEQRVRELREAEIILGPTGSNMFNMMFAPPGCWIAELLPTTHAADPAVRDAMAHLALSLGHRCIRIPTDTRKTAETFDNFGRWNILVRDLELRTALDFMMGQLHGEPG